VTTEPGLRERQKAARRNQLVDAAQTLVEENGLDGVTVEQICAKAGVSTRTFFNYFDSKDDAAVGLPRWAVTDESSALFIAGGPTGDTLRDLVHLFSDQLESSVAPQHLGRAMRLIKSDQRLYQRHHALVAQHREDFAALIRQRMGDSYAETRIQLLLSLLWVVTSGAWMRWEAEHGWRYDPKGRRPAGAAAQIDDPAGEEPDTLRQLLEYIDPVINEVREVLASG